MSDPATATWVGQLAGFDKALPSVEQSSDRCVWVQEEPIIPEPVLKSGDCWCTRSAV